VLLLPGAPALPLAPWASLVAADDPACKSDAGGWRVTLQTTAPWLRLMGVADLRGNEDSTMLLRVRWSTARACLEAVEARTQDVGNDTPMESWAVARFAGGAAAGRVVVVPGGEVRQPLECKLGAP
jgi:hypothetical protein